VKLRYTPESFAELSDILDYITARSPQGARRVKERLQAMAALLVRHPYAGHNTSGLGVRRISVSPYPYVIFYETTDDEIIVIGVRHAARDPESSPR
jgi:toxin ParE1/3/4